MGPRKLCAAHRLLLASAVLLDGLAPSTAAADGGLIVDEGEVWKHIAENQQIAVIRLGDGPDVQADLFISLADRSSESHEITYFIPLGYESSSFAVREQDASDFSAALTENLDRRLTVEKREAEDRERAVVAGLWAGSLAISGPMGALVATGPVYRADPTTQSPLATFETANSSIDVYDLNADTDLGALAETSGLDELAPL